VRPEEREQRFRDGMEAWLSGDMERALSFYSPEVETSAADWMNVGEFRGHDGVIKMTETWNDAWEEWRYDLLDVRAVGERHVVARIHVGGRGRGSGIEVNQDAGWVVEFDDDGLAKYLEITRDEQRALELAHEREVSN
jgi:ketosteroid isomerase-like protein